MPSLASRRAPPWRAVGRRGSIPMLLAVWAIATGCAGSPPPRPVPEISDPCLVPADRPEPPRGDRSRPPKGADTAQVVDTATVLAPDRIAPDADFLAPSTWAERMVARQVFATLVRLDCGGAVVPGLARGWRSDSAGAWWTFDLDAGHRFADGSELDAAAVVRSWQVTSGGRWPFHGIAEARADGPLTVAVRVTEPSVAPPAFLAEPELAIAGAPEDGRRVASGGFRIVEVGPTTVLAATGPAGPRVLRIEGNQPGPDARDRLAGDSVPAILVTREVSVIGFARSLPGLRVSPLAWDRAYLLVTTSPPASDSLTGEDRRALVELAVRSDVRPAERPVPGINCRIDREMMATQQYLGYDIADPTARDLAERIVALAGATARPEWLTGLPAGRLTARPTDRRRLSTFVLSGMGVGLVVAVPRHPTAGCSDPLRVPGSAGIVPLVDGRPTLIRAPGGPGYRVLGDGTFLITR